METVVPYLAVAILFVCASANHVGGSQFATGGIRSQREYAMQIAVIDTFIVPKESQAAFLERARNAQNFLKALLGFVENFLKALLGFVEGFLYEKKGGKSHYNYIS